MFESQGDLCLSHKAIYVGNNHCRAGLPIQLGCDANTKPTPITAIACAIPL